MVICQINKKNKKNENNASFLNPPKRIFGVKIRALVGQIWTTKKLGGWGVRPNLTNVR